MKKFGKVFAQAAIAAALIGGTVALSATPASARVVCNRWHCWHVYGYGPYYDGYYDPYYYPSYYGPGVSFGFNFGGGHGGHGGGHSGGHHH
ncbi:MAG TPA: hypothetical protein VJ476_05170 [Rhizomicrobium sp.]|nr:hypothetical protein [Rhizomicrobium sp.]